MEQVDCVVIGAGVVGLATARALALQGREVMVLEAESAFGTQTSARNSEVIHAGIYYATGSLKAQLCVRGRAMLYDYCAQRGVAHKRCGKLIVATNQAQIAQLQTIIDKAAQNGVTDLRLLSEQQAQKREPQLHCVAAIHSPSTGIVDSHGLMLSLLGDLENAGGLLVLNTAVTDACCGDDGRIQLTARSAVQDGQQDVMQLSARTVINAAGLHAPDLAARFVGLNAQFVPRAYYAKGNYFSLAGRAPFSHLIYPVPESAGLGVHLTLDLGGQAKFGPDVQWTDRADDLIVDAARGHAFYAEVRKYWPSLPDGALQSAYAGMRPKINAENEAAADFVIQGAADHGISGLVNLFGIESPGLTSAMAIAERVAAMLASAT